MDKCPMCGDANIAVRSAVVSGFLLERIWDNSKDKETQICHCQRCGFAFYALRPDDEEMGRLYRNYRDGHYQEQRQRHDSWYTEEVNALFDDPEVHRSRQDFYRDLLTSYVNVAEVRSVLDYGGNTGVHIPDFFTNAEKFVFDISGVETVDGVRGFSDFDAVSKRKYDFVMCLSMLEHVSDPADIIEKMNGLVAEGGYLFIEVPFDSPFYKHKPGKLQFLFNKHFSFKAIWDRFKLNRKFPYVMSEHINYFTEDSLRHIVKGNILLLGTYLRKGEFGKAQCIYILVKV